MDQLTVFLLVIVMGAEYKYLVNEQIRQLNYIKSSINKIEVFLYKLYIVYTQNANYYQSRSNNS